DSLSISLIIEDGMLISPITFSLLFHLVSFTIPYSQHSLNSLTSLSNYVTDWPSATVLIITPKLAGLMEVISRASLLLSSALRIFLDTLTELEKGTSTKYRPARESSQDSRGPFVEIGSFTT